MAEDSVLDRLRKERDLYRQCLDLGCSKEPGALVEETLELLRELASAERGYVELQDVATQRERRWSADVGIDEDERKRIQDRISRGVIAEAIETGQTIHTPSAMLDERFRERESVRRVGIEAVLCVPLRAEGMVGAVYLQNHIGGGPFSDLDVGCVETIARFVSAVGARLLELSRRRQEADATQAVRTRLRAPDVLGRSRALADLLERLEVVATMDANVLITGPSGTGKSLLARVLHDNSKRAQGPFVALNCAALPDALIESELFGAERGAHSGVAQRGTVGKVTAAEGGTLFLDEIGELALGVQAKVLQLVQAKEYYRLGGTTPQRADVRIVVATNRDLEQAILDRTFREDLYYRVHGVQLRVPALAERRDDIAVLAEHFLAESCRNNGLPRMEPSVAVLAAIEQEDWPGNVRQLASRCEEAVVNARIDGATTIEVRHVFASPRGIGAQDEASTTFLGARQQWERTFLGSMLGKRDWNVAQTARELEMSRSHLNALIRRYALERQG